MNKKYILSLCIPTYNRGKHLIESLTNLIKVVDPNTTEIIVCDNGSNDNTSEVVRSFIYKNPKIRILYKKNKNNIGFDKNILQAVNLATGKFCWLLGDDDTPVGSSFKKIISVIMKHPNLSLIHLNYSRYDNILKKVTAKKMINGISKDIYFNDYKNFYFKNIDDSYFRFLGTHTITMSSDVVNRHEWNKASRRLGMYVGHNFIHSFVIGTIIKNSNSIYFIAKPQIQYLSNNHRLWPNDIWKDYNNILLNYLLSIGYPSDKIKLMKTQQTEYERREAVTKNKFILFLFPIVRPLYSYYQRLKVIVVG